jgi:hypothetical protein
VHPKFKTDLTSWYLDWIRITKINVKK